MRARGTSAILVILLVSVLLPFAPSASASLDELGHAGEVAELNGSAIGWWELTNGNILSATSQGFVTEYSVDEEVYTEVWSVDTNATLISAAYSYDMNRLAVGTSNGVIIVSSDYQDILYSLNTNQFADGVSWDKDDHLWITLRSSKYAIEYDGTTPSGYVTTTHNVGITDVLALSDGKIITVGRDKKILVHDEGGGFLSQISDSNAVLMKLGVSEDSNHLFSLTDNCGMDVHNTSTWLRVESLNLCPSGQGRSIQQLGSRLMVGMTNGNAFSIDMSDFSEDQSFTIPGEVVGFRSANGSGVYLLSSFSQISEIHLLDTDQDNDGTVDGMDAFPDDPTQDSDFDGDGYGDNSQGNNPDEFPNDSSQWIDSDGDGYGDNSSGNNGDAFPSNPEQHADSDGDGYGDNSYSSQGDKFVNDPTQWNDTDSDGYGDNQEPGASNSDACPLQGGSSYHDRIGCQDTDGDGWSDPGNGEESHPLGNADAFPQKDSQWRDTDGDGFGDNLTGYRGDACPSIAGNSTRAVTYSPSENRYTWIYRYGCIDLDGDGYDDNTESEYDENNDGVLNGNDCTMVGNKTEWIDHDRDCVGSNTDYNDTNPSIRTLEEHCNEFPSDLNCEDSFNPNQGVENITTTKDDGPSTMSLVKDFAVYGGAIAGGMIVLLAVIVGSLKMLGKYSAKRKPDAQYTHQDATRELDAWESGESFETRGGIDEQKGWEDEPLGDGEEETSVDDLLDVDDGTDESESMGEESSQSAEVEPAQEEPMTEVEAPQTPPTEAPPLPPGGLPEGWTTEQWRWYGHQWLERHGQQ